MTTVVAMAVATRLVENEKRGNAIGIILMGLSSSLVLGVPIGTFLSEIFGWRMLFVIIGLLSIVPFLIIYRKVPSIREQERVTMGMQLSILKHKSIRIALMVSLLYVGGYATLFTYITPFLQTTSSLTMTEISLILFWQGYVVLSVPNWRTIGGCQGIEVHHFSWISVARSDASVICCDGRTSHPANPGSDDIYVGNVEYLARPAIISGDSSPRSPDIALSVNTSFIQFGFALGSGLGGLVISRASVLTLNWAGFAAVGLAILLAVLQFQGVSKRQDAATSGQEMHSQ